MKYKFQYKSNSERVQLLNAHSDKHLIEEQNVSEGNFLFFSDTKTLEVQVEQLQQDNLILMDALAMTFEEVMMLRAEIGGTV